MFAYDENLNNPFKAVSRLWAQRRAMYRRARSEGKTPWKARWLMLTGTHLKPRNLVPIRSLNAWHKPRIVAHLLGLSPDDRYMRFGYAASDEQIGRYVEGIDFSRDDVFGIYNRKLELIAMAHLARSKDESHRACAEFGVSVAASARGRSYGSQLFDRAVMHARNHGVQLLFVHALSENTVMLRIARNAGATVERDGTESSAYLKLPPPDVEGVLHELVDEHLAQTDYWLKQQAKDFRVWLEKLQERRKRAVENDVPF
jgi:RimJ/RimL family protein N-acetyltransferase